MQHVMLSLAETIIIQQLIYIFIFSCMQPDLLQGAKKIIFTACHLGNLKLAFTSRDVISTTIKFWK